MPVDFAAPTGETAAAPATPTETAPDNSATIEYKGRKLSKEDVLKKLENADQFIETLKSERAEDRKLIEQVNEQLKKQVDVAELLKTLKTQPANEAAPVSEQAPAVDPDKIVGDVMSKLDAAAKLKQRAENWTSVTSRLTQAFGDKVNEKVAEVAAKNDMTVDEMAEMIKAKPKLALNLFPELNARGPKSGLHSSSSRPPVPGNANVKTGKKYGDPMSGKETTAYYLQRLAQATAEAQ